VAVWRDFFGRRLCGLEYQPLTDESFSTPVALIPLPGITLMSANSAPVMVRRTQPALADGNDDLSFGIIQSGDAIYRYRRREAVQTPGRLTLTSHGDVGENVFLQPTRFVAGAMQRHRIKALVPNIEDRIGTYIPHDTPVLHLLTGYLDTWRHGKLATTPNMRQMFSDHMYDLVALLFGARGDAAEQSVQRGVRAARLAQIERAIRQHALDPDFSLPILAGYLGLSTRYVQKLLAAQRDTSFIQKLTAERLARAHHLLRSPTHCHLPIAEIAYQCGFSTPEHFHRTFRTHYGATPGEVRAGAPIERVVGQ
jgi:AraC-like DNA-binding protein